MSTLNERILLFVHSRRRRTRRLAFDASPVEIKSARHRAHYQHLQSSLQPDPCHRIHSSFSYDVGEMICDSQQHLHVFHTVTSTRSSWSSSPFHSPKLFLVLNHHYLSCIAFYPKQNKVGNNTVPVLYYRAFVTLSFNSEFSFTWYTAPLVLSCCPVFFFLSNRTALT